MSGGTDLTMRPEYRATIERLEAVKHIAPNGKEYWCAREINGILGYPTWREFGDVIERAKRSCANAPLDASKHFVPTHKLVEIGSGAQRQSEDFFLSRAGCYFIGMNGDPKKPEIAAAQAYFAVQTRRMELQDQKTEDEKRVELREKATKSFKKVSKRAQSAGVRNKMQPVFHDQRYIGLYGKSARDVKTIKGLSGKDNLLDRAGALELSAHDFQMNLAADVLERDAIKGEQNAIETNLAVAKRVRATMVDSQSTMPEDLALEDKIQDVKKRVEKQQHRQIKG